MTQQDFDLVCPTCQRAFPPNLVVGGRILQKLVNIVAHCPNGITASELTDLVYAHDPAGGPDSPNAIRVHVWKANQKLKQQGYRIRVRWPGPGARYMLEEIDEPVYSFAAMREAVRSARKDLERRTASSLRR